MLRQEELTFINALSNFQVSPADLKELRMALFRRKKKPLFACRWDQGPPTFIELALGKRKSNELASSGESSEPAKRRPAPAAVSAPLPAKSASTAKKLLPAFGYSCLPKVG